MLRPGLSDKQIARIRGLFLELEPENIAAILDFVRIDFEHKNKSETVQQRVAKEMLVIDMKTISDRQRMIVAEFREE